MDDQKNKSPSLEQLSQLMDGEWQDMNAAECLAGIGADDELRDTWSRWHLIRDVARGEAVASPALASSLTSRIQSAIAEEPTYSNVRSIHEGQINEAQPSDNAATVTPIAKSTGSRFAWPQALTGVALAASVAMATVLGLDLLKPDTATTAGDSAQIAAVSPAAPVVQSELAPVELVSNPQGYWAIPDENGGVQRSDVEQRLNMFLVNHLDYSATIQRSGLLPHSSQIGYEDAQTDQAADR